MHADHMEAVHVATHLVPPRTATHRHGMMQQHGIRASPQQAQPPALAQVQQCQSTLHCLRCSSATAHWRQLHCYCCTRCLHLLHTVAAQMQAHGTAWCSCTHVQPAAANIRHCWRTGMRQQAPTTWPTWGYRIRRCKRVTSATYNNTLQPCTYNNTAQRKAERSDSNRLRTTDSAPCCSASSSPGRQAVSLCQVAELPMPTRAVALPPGSLLAGRMVGTPASSSCSSSASFSLVISGLGAAALLLCCALLLLLLMPPPPCSSLAVAITSALLPTTCACTAATAFILVLSGGAVRGGVAPAGLSSSGVRGRQAPGGKSAGGCRHWVSD
jgi:hypothetical protein